MDKKNIKEIKKGETGKGLLIEHDGYISMSDEKNLPLLESVRQLNESNESKFNCPHPFIVHAVFQKYGIENANGRIYPEAILKREVEKYQQKIKERRAYGECYKPDANILTESGWKRLDEVIEGESVLTLNTETNKTEFKPIRKIIRYHHKGKMIRLMGEYINDLVTPEHGYPVYEYNMGCKFIGFYTAESLVGCDEKNVFIPIDDELNPQYIKNINFSEENYDGDVMCVEVENHTWYVMDNGKAHWTKNCNHPEQATIDLSRIAMNIIELHWEGRTLVGKLEVITTEGFRRTGVVSTCGDEVANLLLNNLKIGVSSRGLGSVEKKLGSLYVGDDFEIVCWDFVSDPITNNAWVSDDYEGLETYKENKDNNSKNKVFEKLEKYNIWLNE